MRTARSLVIGLALLPLVACSSATPVAIRAGDVCESCRRPIQNVRIAAEIVPTGRLALKFRTVSCLARYVNQHQGANDAMFVTDYPTGRMIRVQAAIFVKSEIDQNTKELDYFAFNDVPSAVAFGKKVGGTAVDWPAIVKRVGAASGD
jgi:hypothetical protein